MAQTPASKQSHNVQSQLDSVDIIAEAYRQAQETRSSRADFTYASPAKINLVLLVGARKENGYHPVDTVMQTLSLHDTLSFKVIEAEPQDNQAPSQDSRGQANEKGVLRTQLEAAAQNQNTIYLDEGKTLPLKLTIQWQSGLPAIDIPVEKNLVTRALQDLAKAFPKQAKCGFEIILKKRIPAAGGLGGGSSNAAASLRAAANIWDINDTDPKFIALAQSLGKDIPFFLTGGCAYYSGEGEVLVRTLPSSKHTLVLFKPEEGVSTPRAYQQFDELGLAFPEEELSRLQAAQSPEDITFVNNLQNAAFALAPTIKELQDKARAQAGVSQVMLSGSGSVSFAVCDDISAALRLVSKCKQWGVWSCVASCVPLGVARL